MHNVLWLCFLFLLTRSKATNNKIKVKANCTLTFPDIMFRYVVCMYVHAIHFELKILIKNKFLAHVKCFVNSVLSLVRFLFLFSVHNGLHIPTHLIRWTTNFACHTQYTCIFILASVFRFPITQILSLLNKFIYQHKDVLDSVAGCLYVFYMNTVDIL